MHELNNIWRDVQRGPPDPFLVGDFNIIPPHEERLSKSSFTCIRSRNVSVEETMLSHP